MFKVWVTFQSVLGFQVLLEKSTLSSSAKTQTVPSWLRQWGQSRKQAVWSVLLKWKQKLPLLISTAWCFGLRLPKRGWDVRLRTLAGNVKSLKTLLTVTMRVNNCAYFKDVESSKDFRATFCKDKDFGLRQMSSPERKIDIEWYRVSNTTRVAAIQNLLEHL